MKLNSVYPWLSLTIFALSLPATASEITVIDRQGTPIPHAILHDQDSTVRLSQAAITVDQVDKHFVPFVSVVPPNTSVLFPNSDNVRHHVYSFSDALTFELKLYHANDADPVNFPRPGLVTLGCNIHDTMKAYVMVLDGEAVVTDDAGRGLLSRDPKQIDVWHPQNNEWQHQSVINGTITLDFILDPRDPQAPRERSTLEERMQRFKRHAN